jgi:major membrane immunogen (membrane-anchored lipoprotein)
MKKIITTSIFVAASLLLAACTSSSIPAPSQTPSFKAGSSDGCATASGTYTKNSDSFRNDKEYHDGWFYGRKKCNPADSKK